MFPVKNDVGKNFILFCLVSFVEFIIAKIKILHHYQSKLIFDYN